MAYGMGLADIISNSYEADPFRNLIFLFCATVVKIVKSLSTGVAKVQTAIKAV